MQNRYEEASKELEKLRAMNRYLTTSLRSQESRLFGRKPSPKKSTENNKHFLSELDEDYDRDSKPASLPSNARLRYAGRNQSGHQYGHQNVLEEDPNAEISSFLSSDMPNTSISRLNTSRNRFENSSRKNVSFNNSLNQSFIGGSTSHSFSGRDEREESSSPQVTHRQLSKLDLDEKPHVGTSTYRPTHDSDDEEGDEGHITSKETDFSHSKLDRSTQTTSGSGKKSVNQSMSQLDWSFSSNNPRERSSFSTTIPATINAHTSSTSVIAAFRELQNRIKSIENERYLLNQEKDDLKNRLLEMKRSAALEKNKNEIETTESLLQIRSVSDKFKKVIHDLQYQYLSQQDIQSSLEKKLHSQEQYYQSLQQDIIHYQEKLLNCEKEQLLLNKDRSESNYRVQDIEVAKRLSPQKHARHEIPLQQELTSLESEIQLTNYENQKLELKMNSLQSYIDVIIKINGDLCDTLIDRERAKTKFLRSLSPPPRYTWPKEIPYNNILQVVNDAAKVQASAVLENTAVKATEAAMKSIIEAISPTKSAYSSPTRRTSGGGSRGGSPNEFRRLRNSRRVEIVENDQQREPPVRNSPEKIQQRLEHSLHNLADAQKNRRYAGSEGSDDDERNETNRPLDRSELNHSVRFDEDDLNMHSGEEEEDDGRHSDPGVTEKRKTRRVKKRTSLKGRKRSSSASGGFRRSSSLNRRQSNSLEKLITRQGAINSATRFAAAANAAMSTTKVVNAPTPVNSHSRHNSPGGASRRSIDSKIDFIPSSGPTSNEFNVIASVSKASRAAKQLNAHLASKVKSLHNAGIGSIFEEFPRVDLIDMQHQLSAVKKMRETLK